MINPYGEEHHFNRFLLISIVLHAIIFLTYPQWSSIFESDVPGTGDGGVIQIFNVQSTVPSLPSPVVDPVSQTTRPRVTEPRPLPEQPPVENAVAQPLEPEVPEPAASQPSPTPDPVMEEPTIPERVTESEIPTPEIPEPAEQPQTESTAAATVGEGELLTSESGQEVVLPDRSLGSEEVVPPTQPHPQPQELPPSEANVGASGSGTGIQGEDDSAGVSQSGTGEADAAPPPPPPPPSGRVIGAAAGNFRVSYPKNAEHLGVQGTVQLQAVISAAGEVLDITLVQSSGHTLLDTHAGLVAANYPWPSDVDNYWAEVFVDFTYQEDQFSADIRFGETGRITAP